MKHGFIIMNQNPKDNQWNDDTRPLLPRKSLSPHLLPENLADLAVLGYDWTNQEKGETVNSVR
jgi:hypothetical protein